jgi:serine/threonine-protein kinase
VVQAGDAVGQYVVEALVGKGGCAAVYRARSRMSGELVALKVLHPDLGASSEPVLRFRREAEALTRLDHPGIVKVFEIDEIAPGMPYLAMEWIEGHTLQQELRARGPFMVDEVLGVLEPLCGALAAIHAVGVIHRDLKLSNVMVSPEGDWIRIKLVDFGIAKMLDPDGEATRRGLTGTGAILGTPPYMAPEQFLGSGVDERTDVYALGIITYALLTARLPFNSGNLIDLADMHLTAAPPRVGSAVPVPQGVDDAIARCLAKRPADRYAGALDFLDDLRRVMRSLSAVTMSAERSVAGAASRWVGIHVAIVFRGSDDEIDDEVLFAIDEGLDRAQTVLAAAGMSVTPAAGNAILAARAHTGSRVATEEQAAAINLALGLHAELVAMKSLENLSFTIAVHATDNRQQLDDVLWTARNPWGAVTATREILAGIEGTFALRSLPEMPDRLLVEQEVTLDLPTRLCRQS